MRNKPVLIISVARTPDGGFAGSFDVEQITMNSRDMLSVVATATAALGMVATRVMTEASEPPRPTVL
jgi:hypothetical protein